MHVWIIQVSIRMVKTVRSSFAAIHPFQIAHEVSNWLGIARREPGLRDRKVSQIACSPARGADDCLQGHYTVAIDFSLADLMKVAQSVGINVPTPPGGEAPGSGLAVAPDPVASPSVTDAVQALGLKLESRRAPIEQLVIDHAEKAPTNE